MSWYPEDVRRVTPAIFDVAARLVAAEEDEGVYPDRPSRSPGPPAGPIAAVIARAELDDEAGMTLRILCAAELDRGVQRVLRRLAADVQAPGIPVDAIAAVVEGLGGSPVAVLTALRPGAPLVARGLVEVIDPATPPLAQRLTMPARLVDFLASGVATAPPPPIGVEPALAVDELCPMPVRGDDATDAAAHLRRMMRSEGGPLWLVGPPGAGRKTLCAAIAAEAGVRTLTVRMRDLLRAPAATIAALWRERLLGDAVVCIHDAEARGQASEGDEARGQVDERVLDLAARLGDAGVPVVYVSTTAPPANLFEVTPRVLVLGKVAMTDALALWQRGLPELPEATPELATRFPLPPGRIVRAIASARALAAGHDRPIAARDVADAIAIGVAQDVSALGSLVEERHDWDDVILPPDTLQSIQEIIARVQHRHRVLDDWGFRDKLAKGLGLAALFSGPPGTGKTMVASLIARDLGQDLYQVDLSRMVSKWIGETEKNLARVFDAAEGANVMLLFDEADALFSKRTEVRSSNDRHSNAEINYLLQRIERFEGVCVLTTNLEGSIDPAFRRRLAFRVEFPMPDEDERAKLWRRMVPDRAELDDGVDFEALAERYELAGGNIRNALLRAAFLAASADSPITMAVLERAVKLEYRDAGKLAAAGAIR